MAFDNKKDAPAGTEASASKTAQDRELNTNSSTLDAALQYAAQGWYVFPCREKDSEPYTTQDGQTKTPKAKAPYTPRGLNDATTNPKQIRRWWKKHPDALIGINCEMSGLFVIDIDSKHGKNGYQEFEKLGINHSGALCSRTPSGGMHIVFSGTGSSTTGKNGIDTRGKGGYIILPPSIIQGGEFPGIYEALNDWTQEPAPMPVNLLELLNISKGATKKREQHIHPPKNHRTETEKAYQALEKLALWRCDDYQAWSEVGMSLSNLGENGLSLWERWSKKSSKYEEGVCAEKWKTFTPGNGLSLGSLYYWALQDSPPPISPQKNWAFLKNKAIAPETNPNAVPDLPNVARLSEQEIKRAKDAGRWVDEYISFASKVSPMTSSIFHENLALSAISTVIARRIVITVGTQSIFPNLYSLLIAPSTLFAKTTGFKIMQDILKEAGLDILILPTGVTPQSLISELTKRTPPTFENWSEDDKDEWSKERIFASQRSWYMDEAASLLDLFQQKHTASLRSTILKLYDCPTRLTESTIGRGRETVRNAYLTICGPTTPAAMRKHLKDTSLWLDGLFPRFNLVTPNTPPRRAFYPNSSESIPKFLTQTLNALALKHLPMPDEKNANAASAIQASYSNDIYKKWDAYHEGIWQLIAQNTIPEKLHAAYGRMPTTVIKIATLLAAIDWANAKKDEKLEIQIHHWARAQMITEEYRASLHRLLDMTNQASPDEELVEKILIRLQSTTRNSRREIAQDLHMSAGTKRDRLNKILDQLIADGFLIVKEERKSRGPSTMRLYLSAE